MVVPHQRSRNPLHWVVLACAAIVLIGYLAYHRAPLDSNSPPDQANDSRSEFLFCFWNVENLFDDHLDHRDGPGDLEYDTWFARDAVSLKTKLDHLCKTLLSLNEGRGPDILAIAEVESERAAELLKDALNSKLSDPALHYGQPLMKEVSGGRHIAPAILTRLSVQRDRTRLLNRNLRILEGHLLVNGQPLVVLASHWTSRQSDERGLGRDKYADRLYAQFKAMYLTNASVDLLICGDFNDTPNDDSVVKYLHATADRAAVLQSRGENPLLYSLSAGRDPKRFGTHFYRQPLIFDQIVVSPGLLDDRGWTVEADTLDTINQFRRRNDTQNRPWGFGREKDRGERGYSDHFPVTVKLKVNRAG